MSTLGLPFLPSLEWLNTSHWFYTKLPLTNSRGNSTHNVKHYVGESLEFRLRTKGMTCFTFSKQNILHILI